MMHQEANKDVLETGSNLAGTPEGVEAGHKQGDAVGWDGRNVENDQTASFILLYLSCSWFTCTSAKVGPCTAGGCRARKPTRRDRLAQAGVCD